MKCTTLLAALAIALAACVDGPEPIGPGAAESAATGPALAPQLDLAKGQSKYDAAAALAVPKPELRGIDTVEQVVSVATAAAVFNDPGAWGVEITGGVVGGAAFETVTARLDTVGDPIVVSSNEVEFDVGYAMDVTLADVARVCVQMIRFTAGGEKYLGTPDCDETP